MSFIEFFSQPLWYRLGLTLTHFLWQGLVVVILISTFVRLFRLRAGNARYYAYLLAFVLLAICPVITFIVIDASLKPATKVTMTGTEHRADLGAYSRPTTNFHEASLEREADVARVNTTQSSIPLRQRISSSLESLLPWAIVGWIIGVVSLSIRLLLGFVGVCRWRRNLKPLPENLAQRVALLCKRLGMRHSSRVFISPLALQAMAAGYLRPLVLLPVSMVTQMQPEMLEAVIAHELAHIRRLDLWINLAQRVIETLLFYHPAVWWLSRQLRSERELCCDELAITATGERLTYASALESADRARFKTEQPALSLTFRQHRNSTLDRVHHILGLPPALPDSRFWIAGVIAAVVLIILTMPITSVLTAREEAKANITSLHEAVATGDIERVKSLISEGADINGQDESGRTPLHLAILNHHPSVAQVLIAKDAYLDVKDKNGCTPLALAALEGRIATAELLIAKGANVNAKDVDGNTPIHLASIPEGSYKGRHQAIIRRLIANGADVNARNAKGETPAHVAAGGWRDAHAGTVLTLNKLGTDVNAKDKSGNTLLNVAAKQACVRVTEDLLAKGANINETNAKGQTPLHIAASHEVNWRDFNIDPRRNVVQVLVAQGANVNASDQSQSTALHEAARAGHRDIVEILVANGANVNAKDVHGHVPAYLALRASYSKVSELLIDKEADTSSIYFAAYLGELPKVMNMMTAGQSVNKEDETGFAPLHAAAVGGHKDVVEYLITQGANATAEAQPGWTALSYAAAGNHMEIVELLRSKGVGAGKGASELLFIVARRGYVDAARILIDLDAEINVGERTALHEATEAGHKEMVALLISNGADVNAGSWTPLHVATQPNTGYIDIAGLLIDAGADIEAGDWTPLMEAAYYHKDMVSFLISKGANVNAKTSNGWTVLDSAADDEGRPDIADLLRKHGAKE